MVDTDSLRVEVVEGEGAVVVALVGDLDSAVAGIAPAHLEEAIETAESACRQIR